jgi:hypothetical protein
MAWPKASPTEKTMTVIASRMSFRLRARYPSLGVPHAVSFGESDNAPNVSCFGWEK